MNYSYSFTPRYTPGSRGYFWNDEYMAKLMADEREHMQMTLTGAFGERAAATAKSEGLRGIAFGFIEHRGEQYKVDLITGEIVNLAELTPAHVKHAQRCVIGLMRLFQSLEGRDK